jgi:hypothetical protein
MQVDLIENQIEVQGEKNNLCQLELHLAEALFANPLNTPALVESIIHQVEQMTDIVEFKKHSVYLIAIISTICARPIELALKYKILGSIKGSDKFRNIFKSLITNFEEQPSKFYPEIHEVIEQVFQNTSLARLRYIKNFVMLHFSEKSNSEKSIQLGAKFLNYPNYSIELVFSLLQQDLKNFAKETFYELVLIVLEKDTQHIELHGKPRYLQLIILLMANYLRENINSEIQREFIQLLQNYYPLEKEKFKQLTADRFTKALELAYGGIEM